MKRFAMIPLAFLLMLLPAAPSFAKHGGKDKYQDTVKADFRCGNDMQQAALSLEHSTLATFKKAKRLNRHPNKGERRALRTLKQLYVEARQFRIATEEHHRLRPIVGDFRELSLAHQIAGQKFHKLNRNKKVRREFRRTSQVMAGIADRFQPVLARIEHREDRQHARHNRDDRRDRHDRYDRKDRNDRHDRHARYDHKDRNDRRDQHASVQWSWRINGWR